MKVTMPRKEKLVNRHIPEGQLFWAESVGSGGTGMYLKHDDAIWPMKQNGQLASDGQQYSSLDCPVTGYDPVEFERSV